MHWLILRRPARAAVGCFELECFIMPVLITIACYGMPIMPTGLVRPLITGYLYLSIITGLFASMSVPLALGLLLLLQRPVHRSPDTLTQSHQGLVPESPPCLADVVIPGHAAIHNSLAVEGRRLAYDAKGNLAE